MAILQPCFLGFPPSVLLFLDFPFHFSQTVLLLCLCPHTRRPKPVALGGSHLNHRVFHSRCCTLVTQICDSGKSLLAGDNQAISSPISVVQVRTKQEPESLLRVVPEKPLRLGALPPLRTVCGITTCERQAEVVITHPFRPSHQQSQRLEE